MKINEKFREIYGVNPERTFFSPGRINIIGDHIDYNGGKVFPAALDMGTYGAFRKCDDRILSMYSDNFSEAGVIHVNLDEIEYKPEYLWCNYVLGVIYALEKNGYKITSGLDMCIAGNIPYGSGLSSSASLELLCIYAISSMFDFGIDRIQMALIGQIAENEFCMVNSGIMDQFAVAMGQASSAILLDTHSLEYSYVPINLSDSTFVICCTNKKRGLKDSKYNERRMECERALSIIKTVNEYSHIKNLCELTSKDLVNIYPVLNDDILSKRVRHVVTENERTYGVIDAFATGNLMEVGRLMQSSDISLRDDYEVTGRELDAIYEGAMRSSGIIGSRMTGAGFGGCNISLVYNKYLEEFKETAGDYYKKTIGYDASFFEAKIGDGVRELL